LLTRRNSFLFWSGREDLNLRPLEPHSSALPDCATPRQSPVTYRIHSSMSSEDVVYKRRQAERRHRREPANASGTDRSSNAGGPDNPAVAQRLDTLPAPIYPPRLSPGATLGVVTPSSPFDPVLFQQGLATLRQMGFEAVVFDRIDGNLPFLAGDDRLRARSINRAFADRRIDGIVCARGGYGAMRALPHIDFDGIRRHPKCIIGFSDVSALLSALTDRCGLVTFHGPVVTTLARADAATIDSLFQVLTGDQAPVLQLADWREPVPGTASGVVAGGNLATLCHLVGTPFQPRFGGQLLLLEDCGEAPYRIDRMLSQMHLAGCFDGLRGVLLGQFQNCGRDDELGEVFRARFAALAVPVLHGLPSGHLEPNLTLPLGLPARMDTGTGSLAYDRPPTRAGHAAPARGQGP
jgi:muramoyltetrapeptide carboxypeptidase